MSDRKLYEARMELLRRSNRNFNPRLPPPPPPSRANQGHLTILCARGVGNLTFACLGWGKLNRKCEVSNDFFSSAELKNTCLDEMEEFKGRDVAFEHHFGPRGREFERFKKFKSRALPGGGGDVEVSS